MGGTTFTVKRDDLRALASAMLTTADDLEVLADTRGEYATEVGDETVAHELSAFFQHWSDGILRISGDVRDIGERLKLAADTYDEVEFDECGAIKPELLEYTIYQVIGPRVFCLGLGGTPGLNRRKIFYDMTRPGATARARSCTGRTGSSRSRACRSRTASRGTRPAPAGPDAARRPAPRATRP